MSLADRNTRRRPLALVIILSIILVICLAGGAWYFLAGRPPVVPLVTLQEPASGALGEVNSPLPVQAAAYYDRGMDRLELYADGALVLAVDTTLPDGSNPLALLDNWVPLTAGRHVLMVRGYARDGKIADSNLVFVDVVASFGENATTDAANFAPEGGPYPSLNDIAAGLGFPPEELAAMNPGLDPGQALRPDAPVTAPRPPRNPPASSPPAPRPGAPERTTLLNADPTACGQFSLTWSDVSGESGYAVHRASAGGTDFENIRRLPADSTTYTDAGLPPGTYYYQIEVESGSGRSLSNVLSVATRPECANPAPSGTSNLLFSWFTLETAEYFDGVYCYASVDGGRFERFPQQESGVLSPGPDGLTYSLPAQLPNRGQFPLPATPSGGSVSLVLDCWGRAGAESRQIGRIAATHGPGDWDGRDLIETAFSTSRPLASLASPGDYALRVRYRIGPDWLAGLAVPDPIDPSLLGPLAGADLDLLRPVEMYRPDMPVPTNVRMGRIGPLSRLMWDWSGGFSPFTESTLTGYRIIVRATDTTFSPARTTMIGQYTHEPGTQKNAWPPAIPVTFRCGFIISIRVQAYQGEDFSGESDPLVYNTPPCTENPVLTITVQQLQVGFVRDDEFCFLCRDARMEIWNYYDILGAGHVFIGPHIPGNFFRGTIGHGGQVLNEGDYEFPQTLLLRQFTYRPAPGETLLFQFNLWDQDGDTGWDFDLWCVARAELAARSSVEWQRINEDVVISDDRGEASCRFLITVVGSPAP